jgi:hypothetical protein
MSSKSSTTAPKPDLTEHEEEAVPFDEVMKKLVNAKPAPKKPEEKKNQETKP